MPRYSQILVSIDSDQPPNFARSSPTMSSFFTLPASQRKRKREDGTAAPSSKKRITAVRGTAKAETASRSSRPKRDDSISSDDSETGGKKSRPGDGGHTSSESESEDETAAERRLRLAEQYLQNIRGEVDEIGFDAEEIDKDLIAERLQEDVVCTVSGPEAVFIT